MEATDPYEPIDIPQVLEDSTILADGEKERIKEEEEEEEKVILESDVIIPILSEEMASTGPNIDLENRKDDPNLIFEDDDDESAMYNSDGEIMISNQTLSKEKSTKVHADVLLSQKMIRGIFLVSII
jgi:hypothetical protein